MMMADKENLPANCWVGSQLAERADKMPTKHVAFRLDESEENNNHKPAKKMKAPSRSDDEGGSLSNGNVTPGNQTSEILMEKMRELRERLEKLKQKNRKSVEEGGSAESTAPSTPSNEDKLGVKEDKPSSEHWTQDAADEVAKHATHSSPAVDSRSTTKSATHSSTTSPVPTVQPPLSEHQLSPSFLPPRTQQTAAVETQPSSSGPSSSSVATSGSSASNSSRVKVRTKLPTPLSTVVVSNVTARKKGRIPAGSILAKPPQRVTVDEARAQLEQAAIFEIPAPEPAFRAPTKNPRDNTKEQKTTPTKEEATGSVTTAKDEDRASDAAKRETRRSREVSAAALRQSEENTRPESTRKEQPARPIEIINITSETAVSVPAGATFTADMPSTNVSTADASENIPVSKKSNYKSPIPARRTQHKERENTESNAATETQSERTRDQDRSRLDTSTTAEGGQDTTGLSQEKMNLLAIAQQRGALEFLYSFATGETSFLTVNGRRYMKLNQIGRGGSSKVYRVVSPNWTTYALKYVPLKNADTVTEESYLNEISLLKKLNHHDNIIRLVDSEVRSGGIFLLLEYAELDLDRMLKTQQQRNKEILTASNENGQPPPSNLLPSLLCLNSVRLFWQQMLEAVHTIHEERVVHGDLKPANFVCIRGRLKLIDFGIAKAISNDTTNIVRDNQIGTLNYISPEALIDTSPGHGTKFKLGRASDIWSLGCILYQMVYGRSPFAMLDNMIRKLQAITNPNHQIDYPPIGNPPLLDTMKLCLQFDPRQRPTIPELLMHPFLK